MADAEEEAPAAAEAPAETPAQEAPATAEEPTAAADAETEPPPEAPAETVEGDAAPADDTSPEAGEETVEREGRTRFDEVVDEKPAEDAVEEFDEFAEDQEEKAVEKKESGGLGVLPSGFDFVTVKSKDALTEKPAPDSKFKMALGSVISIRKTSLGDVGYDKKAARFMNTYRLDSQNPFNSEQVEKVLVSVMTEALESLTYDADKCAKQAKWASSAIRAKVKDFKYDRYKLICIVSIGEKNSQDVLATCRFLWDIERDRYATFALENTFVYGYAQCFGLYYE